MEGKQIVAAKWYAVYVKSRFEKKSAWLLERDGVEVYLPLITSIKQWSDRRKKVEEPLFKSYVFVHTDLKNYFDILNVPGVVTFVHFEGKPVDIPENQINAIREYVGQVSVNNEEVSIDNLHLGQKVMVKYGGMKGIQGDLLEFKGKQWIVVDFEMFGRKLPVQVEKAMVEPVSC